MTQVVSYQVTTRKKARIVDNAVRLLSMLSVCFLTLGTYFFVTINSDLDPTQLIDDAETGDDSATPSTDRAIDLDDIRIALVGRFGGMNHREAASVLRSFGAIIVDQNQREVDWIVVGADESPLAEADLLTAETKHAVAVGTREVIHESDLWQRLGLVDIQAEHRQYYTPVMLAHLLDVSVRVIRRWHRLGLITPVQTLHSLPYFDFAEVASARRLASWIAKGESPKAIERRLAQWARLLPNVARPLDQLSILVEGKEVLLRGGEGLIEPGGQMRFDFEQMESSKRHGDQIESVPSVLSMNSSTKTAFNTDEDFDIGLIESFDEDDELLALAYAAEDEGELQSAIDCYHAILARDGARADINFQVAELLYRLNEPIAARERYYASIELDPEMVEARASLGMILLETGQPELAVAAFRGALEIHMDYPEVHNALAEALKELGNEVEAIYHWKRFLELAPESPWASDVASRLRELESNCE